MEFVNGVVEGPMLSGSGTTEGTPSYTEMGGLGMGSGDPTEPFDGLLDGIVVFGVSAAVGETDSAEGTGFSTPAPLREGPEIGLDELVSGLSWSTERGEGNVDAGLLLEVLSLGNGLVLGSA